MRAAEVEGSCLVRLAARAAVFGDMRAYASVGDGDAFVGQERFGLHLDGSGAVLRDHAWPMHAWLVTMKAGGRVPRDGVGFWMRRDREAYGVGI